jgi:hypothetical protein
MAAQGQVQRAPLSLKIRAKELEADLYWRRPRGARGYLRTESMSHRYCNIQQAMRAFRASIASFMWIIVVIRPTPPSLTALFHEWYVSCQAPSVC